MQFSGKAGCGPDVFSPDVSWTLLSNHSRVLQSSLQQSLTLLTEQDLAILFCTHRIIVSLSTAFLQFFQNYGRL